MVGRSSYTRRGIEMAGLPGTGLGGVFYVMLVAWMALRECWLAARGSRIKERWFLIARVGAMAGAIIAALWGEGLILHQFLTTRNVSLVSQDQFLTTSSSAAGPAAGADATVDALAPVVGLTTLIILAALLISVRLANRLFSRRLRVQPQSQLALEMSRRRHPVSRINMAHERRGLSPSFDQSEASAEG